MLRGSFVPAVLAAVTVATGCETSSTFSRFVSVNSSFDGVIATDGSDGIAGVAGSSIAA